MIYVGCYDSYFYAISSTGNVVWKYKTGYAGNDDCVVVVVVVVVFKNIFVFLFDFCHCLIVVPPLPTLAVQ
jgi:outer membrane protein assembly factor BamB